MKIYPFFTIIVAGFWSISLYDEDEHVAWGEWSGLIEKIERK